MLRYSRCSLREQGVFKRFVCLRSEQRLWIRREKQRNATSKLAIQASMQARSAIHLPKCATSKIASEARCFSLCRPRVGARQPAHKTRPSSRKSNHKRPSFQGAPRRLRKHPAAISSPSCGLMLRGTDRKGEHKKEMRPISLSRLAFMSWLSSLGGRVGGMSIPSQLALVRLAHDQRIATYR